MRTLIAATILANFFVAGCGDGKPKPAEATGTITLDGKPLPDGKVYFVPTAGAAPVIADVADGAFKLEALPGSYKVEVRQFKPVKNWQGEPHDKEANALPARYNTTTTLTAEVKADGPNEFSFPLKSR